MAEIGSLEVSLSLNASNFNGTVAQVDRNLKSMGSELQVLKSKGSDYEKSIDGIAKKKDILARSTEAASLKLQEQRKKYDELVASGTATEAQIERQATAVNKAQTQYNNLERQLAEVTKQLQVQSSQWTQAGQKLQETGSKMQSIGSSMTSIGKDLSMKVTAPITALGVGAFKASVDFESAFAGVRKTVDTSEEGFKKLEQGIRDMAKELPASASDIAAVAESAGQLGIAEDKILSFSRTIIDLGESTNMTREQAATEFARFANIVGMSQDNFDRLGSSIVGLGNTMATTESEIMSMGMRLAGQGAQIGMTEAQIMALAGTMSSLGIQAEMGGTAMTTVLKKMQSAVMDGGAALGTWAEVAQMSSGEFKKLYDESAVAGLDAVVKGLSTISSRGENLTEVLRDMGIKGIYESDVMMRMAGASDLLSSAVETSTNAWKENTALSDEAAQRYATTASQLAMLKNKIVDIGITLGDVLIPMVMNLLNAIEPWIEKFSKLSEGTQKLIVIMAGITAAIGPIIIIIGALISSIGTIVSAIGALALAIGEAGGLAAFLATKFAFLGTVFAALISPIGLTVTALVTGAILIIKYWEPISEFFGVLSDKISEGFNSILSTVSAFGGKMSEVPSMMMSAWSGALSAVTGLLENLKEKLSFVTDVLNVSNAMDALKVAMEAVASTVLMLLGPWGLLANVILKLFNHTTLLQDTFAMLKGEMSFGEVASNFANSISDIINKVTELLPHFIKLGTEIIVNLINGVSNNIGNLTAAFTEIVPAIINSLVMIIPQIILLAADIITKLAEGITNNLPQMVKAITSLIELITITIATLIPQLVEVGVTILTTLINGIVTALPMIIEVVVQLIETLISSLTTTMPILLETGLSIIETLLNGIVTALPLIVESALNIIMSLVEGIIVALPALIEVGLSVITTLLEGIVAALPTIIEAALTIIIALCRSINFTFTSNY